MKSCIGWVIGSFIAIFLISWWNGGEIDWEHFAIISIAGLVGTTIGFGVEKAIKDGKSK
ncbi:hypothetical protein ACFOGI_02980 [Virgibacillus xinjiangensis]|uniref:Uncharacterized protein n=1 Tax=Virgibacillus xinjiangensis TaxID=393090 RepID=A0ABV7CS85_9BACI